MAETGGESKGSLFNVPDGFRRRGRSVTVLGIVIILSLFVSIGLTTYYIFFTNGSTILSIIIVSLVFSNICAWIFLYSIMHTSRLVLMLLHMLVAFGRSPDEVVAVLKDLRRILEGEQQSRKDGKAQEKSEWVQEVRNKQKRKK